VTTVLRHAFAIVVLPVTATILVPLWIALAPWDPPAHLVVRGPYRYVRNPMISGVLFIIIAESLVLRSFPHAAWAAVFLLVNMIYIPFIEEPQLERRFGDEYRQYKRDVPRFVPRMRAVT
jgi:protein-S-isoprenylcysteine O-methyltransferase Ste14